MTAPTPDDLLAAWRSCPGQRRMLWRGEHEAFVAWGVSEEVESQGPRRFEAARDETQSPGLPWIGGFAFDESPAHGTPWEPWGALRLWRPRGMLEWKGGAARQQGLAAEPQPVPPSSRSAPEWGLAVLDKATWKASVRGALRAIRAAIDSGDPGKMKDALRDTISLVDKMAGKKVIHRNAAARYKSRLAKRVSKRASASA